MKIHICNKQTVLPITPHKRVLQQAATYFLEKEKIACDELSIFFITDRAMRKLHKDFFDDDSPTDCITLPIDIDDEAFGPRYLGDIFVCPETAIRYSAKKADNPYKEVLLYIVHGLLHLIGYDDIVPEERKKMKQAERKYMNYFTKQGYIPL